MNLQPEGVAFGIRFAWSGPNRDAFAPLVQVCRLADFPYIVVRLRCDVCKRAGAYRLARLAAKYGSEILLDDLLVRISADCAWRDELRASGCPVQFADLPPRRPPDLPTALRMRVIPGGKA